MLHSKDGYSGECKVDVAGLSYFQRWKLACGYAHQGFRLQPMRCCHAWVEVVLQWLLYAVLVSVAKPVELPHAVALLWLLLWSAQLSWVYGFISEQGFVGSYSLERLQAVPGLRWRSRFFVAWLWQSLLLGFVVLPFAAMVLGLAVETVVLFAGLWFLQSPALLLWAMLSRLILLAMPQSLMVAWLVTLPWVLPVALWTETLMLSASWALSLWPLFLVFLGWQCLALLWLPTLIDKVMVLAYLRHWMS